MKHKEKRKHLEKKFLQKPAKKSSGPRRKLDSRDALRGGVKVRAPTQDHKVANTASSTSEDFSEDKFLDADLHNAPEDASETHEVVPSSSLEAGENCSASEHLPCVSCSSKHVSVDHDGPGSSSMLLNEDTMAKENFSFMPHSHLPSSSTDTAPVSAVSVEKKRVMNVYYKPVQMKRGVAALEDAEDEEPPAKMIRRGKTTHAKRVPPKASRSCVYLGDIRTDGEDGLDREDAEEMEEAENLDREPGPSAKTLAGLEAMYSGFRCMGCSRVFPNLQMLKKHLVHAGEEGVSCLNLAFAKLGNKGKKLKRITSRENHNATAPVGGVGVVLSFLLFLAFRSLLLYCFNK